MSVEPPFSAGRPQAISQADLPCVPGFLSGDDLLHDVLPTNVPQGDALPAVRPPTGQVATEAVLEREAHLSLQQAKAQAHSCEQCSWRQAVSGDING